MEFFIIVAIIVFIVVVVRNIENKRVESMGPDERRAYYTQKQEVRNAAIANIHVKEYGSINSQLICPHCQSKGKVRTKTVTRKKGISGGKATGALLTGGVSILATGLSRKETNTQAHCENCNSTWDF